MHVAVTAPQSLLYVAAGRAWTRLPIVVEVAELAGLPEHVIDEVEEQLPAAMISDRQLAELEADERVIVERLACAPIDAPTAEDVHWQVLAEDAAFRFPVEGVQ